MLLLSEYTNRDVYTLGDGAVDTDGADVLELAASKYC
mgnify:CR=1 FL=1